MTQELYKKAGVDVAKADELIKTLIPIADATKTAGVMAGIGKFAAVFDLGKTRFKDPLLLCAVDGVGTKILLAERTGLWGGIGKDLVAMCVNDVAAHGGEPLFFLDYLAASKLDNRRALTVIKGVAAACIEVGCALVGGETAEMPELYPPGACDLAGFAVAAVERGEYLDGGSCGSGDVVLGLAASGAHANGFSLLRKLTAEVDINRSPPFASRHATIAEALLEPTSLYVRPCLRAAKTGKVRGFAHVTGGGLAANLARIIPDGLCAEVTPPPLEGLFAWLRELANTDENSLRKVFNCGIGMVAVVKASAVDEVEEAFGQKAAKLGEITDGDERVRFI